LKKVGTEKGDKGEREEFDSVSTAPLYHLTSAEISACVIISQLPTAASRRDNIVKLIFATSSIFLTINICVIYILAIRAIYTETQKYLNGMFAI
jgi:hypothetical protein